MFDLIDKTRNSNWAAALIISALLFPSPALAVHLENKQKPQTPAESIAAYNKEKRVLLKQVEENPGKEGPHIKLARIYFKLGGLSQSEAAKENNFNHCMTHSTRAVEINHESALGYFFRGICRGKRGKVQGIFKSFDTLTPFKNDMETALKLDPKVSHGGPNRALGKMYNQLPFFMGGSNEKAIYHLKEAVKIAPGYWENHLFLGQVYYDNSDYNQAMDALREVLKITEANKDDPKMKKKRQEAEDLIKKIDRKMS